MTRWARANNKVIGILSEWKLDANYSHIKIEIWRLIVQNDREKFINSSLFQMFTAYWNRNGDRYIEAL